jgi:ATP-dependent Clp protease ATP-binding subunit ClpA
MFERFTNQARRVVVLAQEESRSLHHNYIGTEHLVLGLLREGQGTGARALEAQDITVEAVRRAVETRIGQGSQEQSGHIPFTPRAKKALELSLRESLALGHNYIGTGHILLGLIRQDDGVGFEILVGLAADPNVLRAKLVELLADDTEEGAEPSPPARSRTVRAEQRLSGPVQGLLDSIDARLSTIERHLGIPRSVPDELQAYDRRIDRVVGAKEEAIERQDFERAAALRAEEKQLRSERERARAELEEARRREGAKVESGPEAEDGPPAEGGAGEASEPGGGKASVAGRGEAPLAGGGEAPLAGGGEAPLAGGGEAPLAGGGEAPLAGGGEAPLAGGAGEVARLQGEVARLLAVLREHGIDLGEPQDPPAATG